mmetsp:Transcript_179817/g.570365  ORF Transcript_179817/g.570365 Transcript_179817/m.570365 type:complete len:270 (+) Transcript_179817:1142-1951(+)
MWEVAEFAVRSVETSAFREEATSLTEALRMHLGAHRRQVLEIRHRGGLSPDIALPAEVVLDAQQAAQGPVRLGRPAAAGLVARDHGSRGHHAGGAGRGRRERVAHHRHLLRRGISLQGRAVLGLIRVLRAPLGRVSVVGRGARGAPSNRPLDHALQGGAYPSRSSGELFLQLQACRRAELDERIVHRDRDFLALVRMRIGADGAWEVLLGRLLLQLRPEDGIRQGCRSFLLRHVQRATPCASWPNAQRAPPSVGGAGQRSQKLGTGAAT